jgi:hypothetical protein
MDGLHHQLRRLVAGCGAAALLGGGGLTACGRDASAGSSGGAAAGVVDSIVPREVALARFREGVPEVRALVGGAPSREALVRTFVTALTAGDTAALRALTLSRAEFAWLYYPTTPQGLPPYDLSPGLMWTMFDLHGTRGMRNALEAYAGRPVRYVGHTCDARASDEGRNTVYGPCTVRFALDGTTVEQRLFGLIVRRDGRFKFVSLANRLD